MAEAIATRAGHATDADALTRAGVAVPAPGMADVWHVALDEMQADEPLSAKERHDPAGDPGRIATRAALRSVLGRYLEPAAMSRPIAHGTNGRPFLPQAPLDFNVARRGRLALIAVTGEGAVGVDLEERRPLPERERIERMLHPLEREALESVAGWARHAAFFRIWTRKEAALKATGLGLPFGLHHFSVLETRCEIDGTVLWLRDLWIGGGFAAALASDLPVSQLRHRFVPRVNDCNGGRS